MTRQTELSDIGSDQTRISQFGELYVAEPIKLAGEICVGTVIDPNYFTTTVTGSGTATRGNATQSAATGTTANSSASISSVSIARFVNASTNRYLATIQMGDTGTVNNTRIWGPFTGSDGAYFKLVGTVLYVATMNAGTEVAIPSTAWNASQVVPLLTNFNIYEIEYTITTVTFYINGKCVHTAIFPTSIWTSTPHLPFMFSNANSGGGTANVTITSRAETITRIGQLFVQPKYFHVTTAATTVCKYGPGTLRKMSIGSPSAGSATITLYDNTAGSGKLITVCNLPSGASAVTLFYDILFTNGLTVVSVGTWDANVIYE